MEVSIKHTFTSAETVFELRPFFLGGHYLYINGDRTAWFDNANDGANACRYGHVSHVVPEETPRLVNTKDYDFPKNFADWQGECTSLEEF